MSTFLFATGYIVIAVLLFFPIKRMIYTCFKAKYPLLYSTVEKRAEMWAEDSGLAYLYAAIWPVGLPITLFMFGPRLSHRLAPEDRKQR